MANAGDTYTITLKAPHLDWGEMRYTDSREPVYGEGYIPIPAKVAYRLKLFNQNGTNYRDILGQNLFRWVSANGEIIGILRAQGNQAYDFYAKQFSVDKDLKALGNWFQSVGANVGDQVKLTWLNSTDIVIELV